MNDQFDESIFERLQRVTESSSTTTDEAEAIKYAANALMFVNCCGHKDEFKKFLDQPLTPEQIAHLKMMGLEP